MDKLLRELANPNLHDIAVNLPFRVELWDRHDRHIRWVIAASSSAAIGHAALDVAIASYPDQRFTLRNGIQVIRQHKPGARVRIGPEDYDTLETVGSGRDINSDALHIREA